MSDYKKIERREEYYQQLALQTLKTFQRACISPDGLAVPPAQINEAAVDFLAKIDDILNRAFEKGWKTGIEDARKQLVAKGIKLTYVPLPEGNKPTQDFFDTRQKLVDRLEEAKPVLQQASGDDQDVAMLKKTLLAVVSVWANISYSYSMLNTYQKLGDWLQGFPLKGNV